MQTALLGTCLKIQFQMALSIDNDATSASALHSMRPMVRHWILLREYFQRPPITKAECFLLDLLKIRFGTGTKWCGTYGTVLALGGCFYLIFSKFYFEKILWSAYRM